MLTTSSKLRHRDARHIAVAGVVTHPTHSGWLIVCASDSDGRYPYANVIDRKGCVIDGGGEATWVETPPYAEAQEAWDKLSEVARQVIITSSIYNKINAIKYLREITGLGLADAKHAVETFSVGA